ncbi:hypothetical protein NMY22_g1489 [Coprinellus aureogranulatus]|nr:hypothetical protein NMY22_g1489 [Coprinellus aureogranulatus]
MTDSQHPHPLPPNTPHPNPIRNPLLLLPSSFPFPYALPPLLPLALAAGTYAFPGLVNAKTRPPPPSSPSSTVIPMANGDCTESIMPISITANNTRLKVDSPENQQALTDFVISWTSDVANFTRSISGETFVNNKTYNINTLLCIPKTQDEKGTVEFVVHGFVSPFIL